MRFRNYRNNYNRRRRIFSEEDIMNMPLSKIFDNENDILAQNNQIGIPTHQELEISPNTKWIAPFKNNLGEDDGNYWEGVSLIDSANNYTSPDRNQESKESKESEDISSSDKSELIIEDNKITHDTPLILEGRVEKEDTLDNVDNSNDTNTDNQKLEKKNSNFFDKYSNLNFLSGIQRELAKSSFNHSSEKEYYGQAIRFADNQSPNEFMAKNNYFYKLSDIKDPELQKMYIEKAAQMNKLDLSDPNLFDKVKDINIVIPKENSQLYKQIKNSEDFKKKIAEIHENNDMDSTIEFFPSAKGDKKSLYLTIHRADLKNSKSNEDNSYTTKILDGYNFEEMPKKKYDNLKNVLSTFNYNKMVDINNNAVTQQEIGKIKPYLLSTDIKLSKEELEEILKRYIAKKPKYHK